jgi:mono/diheme cytochrome c family protein
MRFLKNSRSLTIATVMVFAGHCAYAQTSQSSALLRNGSGTKDAAVTAVTGESWLTHLNRPFGETSMGKTGHLGPPAPAPGEEAARWPEPSPASTARVVTLHGADLYRLNCQGCHGESGQGAPPEINSVINPVRATSIALVMGRMKTAGMDISRPDAAKLAQQSNTALLQRLHDGGQDMPAFPHLNVAEIRSLVAYLKQLAGVPGAGSGQLAVKESPVRIGEHIVKSTCHTCHSATGLDPEPQQIWDGAIPPLSTLAKRKSQPEFIRKVTHGAPVLMGTPPMLYRGRMPVFYYLSEEEAADVYLYLTLYPPTDSADPDTMIALSQQNRVAGGGTAPPQKAGNGLSVPNNRPVERQQPNNAPGLQTVVLLSAVGLVVILLLAGGLGFTILEFQRLSAKAQDRGVAVRTMPRRQTEDASADLRLVS